MPWWRCDGCGDEIQNDVLAHDDWGGEVRVIGPNCRNPECLNYDEVPMDCIGDDDLQTAAT